MRYPRTPGYRPSGDENKFNAWYVKTTIKGAPGGKLAGKRVALKDNVCLAGVPMMNGAATLEGYVPDIDATIVTRMLDAGATILGKAHCECFCLSGGSHTGATGPVHNPHKRGYSAGGSSSGSGALVAAGEVDMAIGGDQGGSIRIPAVVLRHLRHEADLGPRTLYRRDADRGDHRSYRPDDRDRRRQRAVAGSAGGRGRTRSAAIRAEGREPIPKPLGMGCAGLKIGVVNEGFGWVNSEADVDAKVKAAGERLAKLGAKVEEISLPMHRIGKDIWAPIALEGLQVQMMNGNGMGFNWKGLYTVGLLDAHGAWRERANDLSDSLKISMFLGEYFVRTTAAAIMPRHRTSCGG